MSGGMLLLLFVGMTLATLVASVIFTTVARRAALRVGFVDHPGGHKSHRAPTPYAGGIAIFASAWLALLVMLALAYALPAGWVGRAFGETALAYLGGVHDRTHQLLVLLAGGLALHILGLLDDRRPLSPWLKLAVIASVGFYVAAAGKIRVAELWGREISILLTTLWFIVIVNAMNFLDNMDGLSAGIACICLLFFAVCGRMANDQVLVPALACVFLGAIGGFLIFNFPPARIFMGDAGSLVVGYMLATVSVLTTYYQSGQDTPPYALATPFVILAIPLYDFASVVTIRLIEGRNPMQGDQRHFSHRLVDRGLSRRFAVLTIYLATATTGVAATLLPRADLRHTLTVVAVTILVLAIVAILEAPLRKNS